ncbi:MAG: hypothetical protein KDD60_09435 [Bdellovibrionales bacterium]|nr:hypothetical protein [Bdellovibrionales bacterium]
MSEKNSGSMGPGSNHHTDDFPREEIPYLQKLYDRPILLLLLGLVVMFGFYTLWGFFEVISLPEAPLP